MADETSNAVETESTMVDEVIESGVIEVGNTKPLSLDDVLKDPKFQSDFDKKIAKALDKAKTKWNEELELTAEQKAERQITEREQALAEREQAQEKREFTVDLRDELQQYNLPLEFAELIAESSDRDQYKPILKGIKATWDKQIAEAIKSSARQNVPSVGATEVAQTHADLREFAQQNRKVK